MAARNISLRMDDEKIDRIDRLAADLGRSRAWVLNQAAEKYLDYEEWFVAQVHAGIADAEAGKVFDNEDVMAELREKLSKARG